jgi:CheY-like chemotaxis protein/anti-sigma regulatory factor (Ser/Thr protein kinase)
VGDPNDPRDAEAPSSGPRSGVPGAARSAAEESRRGDPHADVSGALHDVSNELTVMLGWIGEARAPGASRDAVEDALRIVEQRARAARDLARRAIGVTPVTTFDEPLGTLVAQALRALAVEAHRAGVRLVDHGARSEAAARTAHVSAAADVSQVLTNLVMNALSHAPRGSEVSVAVAAGEADVTIDVVDQGPGVADARRDSIFKGDSMRPGGAGVGLRHARAIARAAGGELELLRPAGASGAHFRLTWPRADAIPPAPRSIPRLKIFEGTRVLLVEDDAHVTQLLETALTARGAIVTIARSSGELLAALPPGEPHDAVLMDLSPIAADPDSAIDAVRAHSPLATLVVISGSALELPEPLQSGQVRFVRKPFEVGEIVAALAAGRPGA